METGTETDSVTVKKRLINKQGIARAFNRAALTYDEASTLQKEVGKQLFERLDCIDIQPSVILDLGCGTGCFGQLLSNRYPNVTVINLDIAFNMLTIAKNRYKKNIDDASIKKILSPEFICADAECLPIASESIDLIFSNCTLQWCLRNIKDSDFLFNELRRILKPEGALLFSTFGPDTLIELKQSFAKIDGDKHVNNFLDMHDIGDCLLKSGFKYPVMDRENIILNYKNVNNILEDLKKTGANYVEREYKHKNSEMLDTKELKNQKGLTKKNLQRLIKVYEEFRNESFLPATFEIIYGYARSFSASGNMTIVPDK